MDSFGNDEIAGLLRLKRYEQPPASYYENFLSEFRRRSATNCVANPFGASALTARTILCSGTMPARSHTTLRSHRGSAGVRRGRLN